MSKSMRRDRHGTKKKTHAKDQKSKSPKVQKSKSKHGYDAAPLIDWAIVGERLGLSGREMDIAPLLCQGRTATAIARQLGIKYSTVKTHLKRLHNKCGIHDRARFVALVFGVALAKPR